jgi:hypothetical protein
MTDKQRDLITDLMDEMGMEDIDITDLCEELDLLYDDEDNWINLDTDRASKLIDQLLIIRQKD